MTLAIQDLINQRPYLQNPLELYAKWQRFQQELTPLLPKERPALTTEAANAYPQDLADEIFRLFVSIFDLPAEEFAPIGEALAKGEIDFLRLSLAEVPAIANLPCSTDELGGLLFLLTRPYFLALRQAYPLDGSAWQDGHCPLCSAKAALSAIVEGPARHLHCSFCGTHGTFRFIGCPNCGTVDPAQLNTIIAEDDPGFRVSTCDECHTYVKIFESSVLKDMSFDLADMASLPLDIIAQEKGYSRLAPNPISLTKIS